MKQTQIRFFGEVHPFILLENIDDAYQYIDQSGERLSDFIATLMKTDIPVDRWDHLITKDAEGGILSAAWSKCRIEGGSPLLSLPQMFDLRVKGILEIIGKGQSVIINRYGGYCSLTKSHDVVSIEPYTGEPPTYINLSN